MGLSLLSPRDSPTRKRGVARNPGVAAFHLHHHGRRQCVHPQLQATPIDPDLQTQRFYINALRILDRAELPYVVGGGYAMAYYTGIRRNTKDLDIFIKESDRDRCLTTLT